MRLMTQQVLQKADYLLGLLQQAGIPAWKNKGSPCVVCPVPSEKCRKKYHLPLFEAKNGNNYTHVFTMEHVSNIIINESPAAFTGLVLTKFSIRFLLVFFLDVITKQILN